MFGKNVLLECIIFGVCIQCISSLRVVLLCDLLAVGYFKIKRWSGNGISTSTHLLAEDNLGNIYYIKKSINSLAFCLRARRVSQLNSDNSLSKRVTVPGSLCPPSQGISDAVPYHFLSGGLPRFNL